MDLYQNRVVIFIDILGFRKWVHSEVDKMNDDCTAIVDIFRYIQKYYENLVEEEYAKTLQISFFSDSVIISFEESDEDQIFHTIVDLQLLILNLVYRGVLVRGAISNGKLLHTKEFILGPAFMNAYDLETKKSVVPRVICHPQIIGEAMKYKNKTDFKEDLPYVLNLFDLDDDEQLYIDYFDKIIDIFDSEKQYLNYLIKLKEIIIQNLETSNDLNIRGKYLWMKEKYNSVVKKRFSAGIVNKEEKDPAMIELFESVTYIS
jgi:hypothetical protein